MGGGRGGDWGVVDVVDDEGGGGGREVGMFLSVDDVFQDTICAEQLFYFIPTLPFLTVPIPLSSHCSFPVPLSLACHGAYENREEFGVLLLFV